MVEKLRRLQDALDHQADSIRKREHERGSPGRIQRRQARGFGGCERATKRALAELRDELPGARSLASRGIARQERGQLADGRRRQRFGGGAQERRVLNGEVACASEGERLVAIGGKLIGRTRGIAEQVAHGVVVLADGEATERHRAGGIWIAHPRRSTCARRATCRGAGRAACRSGPRRPGRSGAARGACAGRSTGLADRPRAGGDREPAERVDQGSAIGVSRMGATLIHHGEGLGTFESSSRTFR